MQTSSIETIPNPERSIVRSKVFDTLAKHAKAGKHGPFRAVRLFQEICDELIDAEIIQPGPGGCRFTELKPEGRDHHPDFHVRADIARFVRQELWEFYLQRILAPAPELEYPVPADRGPPFSYLDLDYAVLTQYGYDILTDISDRIQVHDPDAYLENFRSAKPEPDPTMMRYLQECVSVFRRGHFLATVVLLGIASERLIQVLAESLHDALGEPRGEDWFRNKYSPKRHVSDRFASLSGKLIAEYGDELNHQRLREAFQRQVTLAFEEIRLARNEIAHPTDRQFTWNEVSGFLHNFVQYFLYVNRIIKFLSTDPKST